MNAQGKDVYGNLVTTAHYHNLGKLMLAFMAFWAYIAFSQFLLVWIANIPEEAPWYSVRIFGGWRACPSRSSSSGFLLPFFILLSRNLKLQPRKLVGAWPLPAGHPPGGPVLAHVAGAGRDGPTLPLDAHHRLRGRGRHGGGLRPLQRPQRYTLPVKDPYIADSLRYVQP